MAERRARRAQDSIKEKITRTHIKLGGDLRRKPHQGQEDSMHYAETMTAIIGGKRYSAKTATEIASNEYWDGHNWERSGHNTFLMRTPNGNFFAIHLTQWQGERDTIEPVIADQAKQMYEELPEHELEFEEAFPGAKVVDA